MNCGEVMEAAGVDGFPTETEKKVVSVVTRKDFVH